MLLQRLLEHILQDILTFSKVFEYHLSHVAQVLQTLKTVHLKILINKCQFAKNSVELLGYLINRNSIVDSTPMPERVPPLPLALASFTLQDASASQEKSGVVIPITILSQHRHISCSALVDTGSPCTPLSENIQLQFNLPAIPLESHYHLFGATGDALTTFGTVQVDIVSHHNIWPTSVIVVSSLAHPLILELNFLKLTIYLFVYLFI